MKRQMERNKSCTCKNCGETFDAVRYNAETCSPKCRKAYSRWTQEVSQLEAQILYNLEKLKEYHNTEAHNRAFNVITKITKRAIAVRDNWES